MTPLKRLEPPPEKGRPLTSWASQDEACTDIAHNIGSIVESRIQSVGECRQKTIPVDELSANIFGLKLYLNRIYRIKKGFTGCPSGANPVNPFLIR